MTEDAFSKYHPAVNFFFFLGATVSGVMIQHPAYLLSSVLASAIYYLLLNGRKGWKMIAGMVPLFLFLIAVNPLFNTRGITILFFVFGRPYTLEALIFGVTIAAVFVVMLMWIGCYNKVLTGDKFTSLFGNIMPSLSLLLVMVFRLIPALIRKVKQIIAARSSIGKGTESTATLKEKLMSGFLVLGVLISWALEGSVVTSDSMRARGYGTAKRSSFMIYRMTSTDWLLLVVMIVLLGVVCGFGVCGRIAVTFLPQQQMAPVSGINILGFISYLGYLLIPTILHIKEVIWWNISRFKN